jgi:hypothetical protein
LKFPVFLQRVDACMRLIFTLLKFARPLIFRVL